MFETDVLAAGCWAATAQHNPNNQRKSIARALKTMVNES
jgi:hypothetical protein